MCSGIIRIAVRHVWATERRQEHVAMAGGETAIAVVAAVASSTGSAATAARAVAALLGTRSAGKISIGGTISKKTGQHTERGAGKGLGGGVQDLHTTSEISDVDDASSLHHCQVQAQAPFTGDQCAAASPHGQRPPDQLPLLQLQGLQAAVGGQGQPRWLSRGDHQLGFPQEGRVP